MLDRPILAKNFAGCTSVSAMPRGAGAAPIVEMAAPRRHWSSRANSICSGRLRNRRAMETPAKSGKNGSAVGLPYSLAKSPDR